MTVTFFGNRDADTNIIPNLHATLVELITKHGADNFYIGNNGAFDLMAQRELLNLQKTFSHIKYTIVLAYMPKYTFSDELLKNSIYPEGIEKAPLRFAICKRNEWMITIPTWL